MCTHTVDLLDLVLYVDLLRILNLVLNLVLEYHWMVLLPWLLLYVHTSSIDVWFEWLKLESGHFTIMFTTTIELSRTEIRTLRLPNWAFCHDEVRILITDNPAELEKPQHPVMVRSGRGPFRPARASKIYENPRACVARTLYAISLYVKFLVIDLLRTKFSTDVCTHSSTKFSKNSKATSPHPGAEWRGNIFHTININH